MATSAVQNPPSLSANHFPNPTTTLKEQQASNGSIETHDVVTTLNYYKDPGDGSEPPPSYVSKPETYDRPSETQTVTVHDVRGKEDQYTLDKHGFQFFTRESSEKDFLDDERIKDAYYKETEQLLKDVTGASQIYIFDHTIRRAQKDVRNGGDPLRGPVQRVHIDQSYAAAPNRVLHHLPDQAERLLKGRYQIINVWRPIKPIYKDPLAVAEASSVDDADLVGVKLIYPDRVGETYTVRPNGNHRWFYLYGQKPEEVTLIKCFDSKTDGRARRVPHTAFVNPATVDKEPRESIEVRALVFHPDDTE